MSNTAPILEVDDLSIALDLPGASFRRVVDQVSFNVYSRKITCLIGESGSGKSVTSSAVMGLLPGGLVVDGGKIRLNGTEMTKATPADLAAMRGRVVSMIFQEPLTALNPVMRVGEQIGELLDIHRPDLDAKARKARIIELIEDVHLPDPDRIISVYPHQLSGGQRQRIVIAMALAMEPDLIIADEPTTALDVTTQAQILHLFRDLLKRHKSGLLMITHDFGVVEEVADHVHVMRNGQIVEEGSVAEVLERPRHDYTQKLLAAVPRFHVRAEREKSETPLVEARGLTLTYVSRSLTRAARKVTALDHVDFHIDPGETLGVVGESGSGKSTLAKVLMLFEKPDAGFVSVFGRDITQLRGAELKAYRAGVQMIFQDPFKSLNPRHRIGSSLIEGPMENGLSKAAALDRVHTLLDRVGLPSDTLMRYPHEFSGGQRQRICIARALAMRPKIVVADEAVSALDVSVQAQVLELIENLKEEFGFSMLFITHDLRVASNVCDRLIVMHRGKIVEDGPALGIFKSPRHEYTRALIDAIPGGLNIAS